MRHIASRAFLMLLALAVCAIPQAASACAVCFGAPEAPMSKGIVGGIWILLFFVMGVLMAVAGFFVYIVRRAAALEAAESSRSFSETINPSA